MADENEKNNNSDFDLSSLSGESFDQDGSNYLNRAMEADAAGRPLLSIYLYLAAFEQSNGKGDSPTEESLNGLKQAWALACSCKERSMAEYIFEIMEPYLSTEEINLCAQQLQDLALDKLEEFGLSRDELEGMAQMLSDDLMMGGASLSVDSLGFGALGVSATASPPKDANSMGADDQNTSSDAALPIESAEPPLQDGALGQDANGGLPASSSDEGVEDQVDPLGIGQKPIYGLGSSQTTDPVTDITRVDVLTFDSIAGYDSTIRLMRDMGIGMRSDPSYRELVQTLNARHGLSQAPVLDALLFRAQAREDANRFMLAVVGELGLPTVHMRMEENMQKMPVLCVSTHATDMPPTNSMTDVLENGGVLVLEDLDLWTSPMVDMSEQSANPLFMMQLTRGAREAVNLIKTAVENKDVYVLATSSLDYSIDPFFLNLIEPVSVIDIENPTAEERVKIWMDITRNHPSIRAINKAELVRLSANMPRFDIYMAAREAIEESYKQGLVEKRYIPVSKENLFDKLAAYQPLDSKEYNELENAVIKEFLDGIDDLDGLLDD